MGGGNLTMPVQRLTDFIAGRPSTTAPSSSYRLGVLPAAYHEIHPLSLVTCLREALTGSFEKKMPGFVCDEALLHVSKPGRQAQSESHGTRKHCKPLGRLVYFPQGKDQVRNPQMGGGSRYEVTVLLLLTTRLIFSLSRLC
jgi:hypothetical protein